MRRAALDKPRTLKIWRDHLRLVHSDELRTGSISCICDLQANRFRKGQKRAGCGKQRCLCKVEKRFQRPTVKDLLARDRERDGFRALEFQ